MREGRRGRGLGCSLHSEIAIGRFYEGECKYIMLRRIDRDVKLDLYLNLYLYRGA